MAIVVGTQTGETIADKGVVLKGTAQLTPGDDKLDIPIPSNHQAATGRELQITWEVNLEEESGTGVPPPVLATIQFAKGNKQMAAILTTSDGDKATSTTMVAIPANDGFVEVLINGILADLSDGDKTKECFFSADSGTTPRAISDIATGDELFWNGSVAKYELETSDQIDLIYEILV